MPYRPIPAGACLFLLGVLSACGGSDDGSSRGTTLRVVALPFLPHGALFIAEEEGYFRDEGIEVELVRLTDTASAVSLLSTGDVDVSIGFIYPNYLNAIARGSPIRFVLDGTVRNGILPDGGRCDPRALLVRKELLEANPGRAELAGALRGAAIAVGATTSAGMHAAQNLGEIGLAMSDLRPSILPPAVYLEALGNGSLALAESSEPWITLAVERGIAVRWPWAEESFIHRGVFFGPTLMGDRRDLGVRFLRALLKGVARMNEGPSERNLVAMSEFTELDVATFTGICWPLAGFPGLLDREAMDEYQRWAVSEGLLDAVHPPQAYWDPSFLDAALSTSP